jgi:transposase
MPDEREQELLAQIAAREAQLTATRDQLAAAELEIHFLRQKLDALARRLFGKKSEQLDPAQLQLLFQELVAPGPAVGKGLGPLAPEAAPARPKKAQPRRDRTPRVPAHLPVIEEVIVPPPVQAAPELWRRMGEEITERLDYEPARFFCHRTIRPKYVRRGELDAVPVIAPLPPCILDKSIATPGLVAQILVAKYCDHLPLYRQEVIYESRHGVTLTRQTMGEWVGVAADWLRLIYEAIRQEVLAGGYAQIDETPIRYLEPGHGETKLGYFWVCHRPGGDSVFAWDTSRAATCLEKIIPVDFAGKSSATATRPTTPLPAAARTSSSPAAGPTCGASSSTPISRAAAARSSSSTSCKIFTGPKTNCAPRAPGRKCGRSPAPRPARPLCAGCTSCSCCGKTSAAFCPKACWARRSRMRWASGPRSCST